MKCMWLCLFVFLNVSENQRSSRRHVCLCVSIVRLTVRSLFSVLTYHQYQMFLSTLQEHDLERKNMAGR